jgi:hypothetical protein
MDAILCEAFFVIFIRDEDHNVNIGGRGFKSMGDGAAEEQGEHFRVALEVVRDALYGVGVMWVHG